jgi:site-specific DNA recombinase
MTAPPRYAAIYARVSTEDQGKGFSIPTQLEACQKLAECEGYITPKNHMLIDAGISGTTMDRPGLRRLRELVTTKAIAAAVVYDPDRLSRNLGHQLLLAEEFDQAEVKLLIVSHPLEQGPEGWLFFQMRGALAEYERAKTLERTRRGKIGRAKAGHPPGGQVPLGYRAIREPHAGRWEIEPEEAALVRRIFAMCVSGMTMRGIARQLTVEGLLTKFDRNPKGCGRKTTRPGVWSIGSIFHILNYQGYTGRAFYGKCNATRQTRKRTPEPHWIEIRIPAIIEDAVFAAAQQQLEANRARARRNRKREYLLTGRRLRCGHCGHAMSGYAPRGVRHYHCTRATNMLDADERHRADIPADEAETRVWQAIVGLLNDPPRIAAEVAKEHGQAEQQVEAVRQEIALVEATLARCDREEQRWADAYSAEVINLVELKGYRAEIAQRRQSLAARGAEVQASLERLVHHVVKVETLIDYCARVRRRLQMFDAAEKRLALDALDVRVTYMPGMPLAVQARIPLASLDGEIVSPTSIGE